MTSLAHHFFTMACNNAWANQRLLGACCRLSQEAFAAPRTGFFPSLKATLNHILTVDRYYIDAIERALRELPPDEGASAVFELREPFDTCAGLARAQRESDLGLVELCRGLSEQRLSLRVAVPRRAGLDYEPLARLLAHLFQHQIHHRGQAHAMLAGTGVAPPQLDEFFCTADARLREDELAALGIPEREIWEPGEGRGPR